MDNPDEMLLGIKDMTSNLSKTIRYLLLWFSYIMLLFNCPPPLRNDTNTKDPSVNFIFLNIDDFWSLAIKLNIIMLSFLFVNYICLVILGGFFIFMENGSSSGSQGQGSNNFTGGGPGGNNGNGPNPGGNNFNGPAAGAEGNRRSNRSTFFDTVLSAPAPAPPLTDTDRLADLLQAKYDRLLVAETKKSISVHGPEVMYRMSPYTAYRDRTVYPSMVLSHLEDTLGKDNIYPGHDPNLNNKKCGAPKEAELNTQLIAKIRGMKVNVPQSAKDG